jgi:hypothetical protein
MKTLFLTAGLLLFFGMFAYAQSTTEHIDKRQKKQQERIKEGVKDGSLTNNEAIKLEAKQADIEATKLADKSKGNVSMKDKIKMQEKQDKAGVDIYAKKHNTKTK